MIGKILNDNEDSDNKRSSSKANANDKENNLLNNPY